ncbi:hypothetical protein CQW23_09524 [Capsicum baccatum]|uniref:Transposase-associated domain-containing protein n=1 Tax=Capsicum baccatum TaxID=33114 RepID=A0A2G2WX10_CAPBA|nr:hypothetical protein CQW23_09524 [Capsicum baccatum]
MKGSPLADMNGPSRMDISNIDNKDRTWMYNRTYPNCVGLREEYKARVAGFIVKAMTLDDFLTAGTIKCPCWNCKCCKLLSPDVVTLHLYRKGFMVNYTMWTAHEESSDANDFAFQNYVESPIIENNVERSRYTLHTQYIFRTDVPHGGPAFHAAGTGASAHSHHR